MTTGTLFTYWHERYDIEILSISTDVHSTEIIPSDIIDYVHHAEEDGIMYILFEKNANSPAGEQVLKELQESVPDASALELHGLGNITPDEFDAGSTYLSIMYENLEVLKQATK
jgi:zinc transport system substrate-binding protein